MLRVIPPDKILGIRKVLPPTCPLGRLTPVPPFNQDTLLKDGFGDLNALSLQKKPMSRRNVFVGEHLQPYKSGGENAPSGA
jgi:hypothetical protein